jgi:hypothetical protein
MDGQHECLTVMENLQLVMASSYDVENRMHWDLLATDFAPTSTEAGLLKKSIEEHEREIREIDTKRSSLELQLEDLRTLRLSLVESCAVKEALLAPMRKLAPEVLGEVFK